MDTSVAEEHTGSTIMSSTDQTVFPPYRILPNRVMRNISNEPGARVADWFNSLFTVIVALSTLGASVTFSYVVSGIRTPTSSNPAFSTASYEGLMAVSWLLFILDLAIATLFSTVLAFFKDQFVLDWRSTNRGTRLSLQWSATLATAILYGLTITAFVLLSLVLTAYAAAVGWVAVGFTAAFGLGGFISIAVNSPAFRKPDVKEKKAGDGNEASGTAEKKGKP